MKSLINLTFKSIGLVILLSITNTYSAEPISTNNNALLAVVKIGKKYGVISKSGKVILPVIYDDIHFYNGMIYHTLNEKCGISNQFGKVIVKPLYD